ncbi:MAG: hypothetical protein KF760_31970 [Candidatus Eremiobacteraeota bacterium]|nr:hypothetical protein [Candidatus Eremiobacteraeota bacterium]MCW5871472.1 hypothetical protein [Candidatus Eremiobacteraeota bacterium]
MKRPAVRGLTIGELVVATGLLALMVVTVMVLFGQMLDATSKNALVSQGSFFAETVIEREIYALAKHHRDPDANPLAPNDGSAWISFTDETNQTEFSYHVDSVPAHIVPGTDDMGLTYSIQVEVRWWQSKEGAARNRQGYGKMHLKRSRIVYVPKP